MPSSRRSIAVAILATVVSLVSLAPAEATTKKPAFKLGYYDAKTSPALEAGTNTGARVSFLMEFKLAHTAASACGGSKTAKGKVYCLTAHDIGAYGTSSTTGTPANCTDSMGDPENSGSWNPVLRVPSSGRVSVDETVRTEQGEPSALIKATLHITKTGGITGTYQQTLYVSTGGDPFLGCTTGPLTLKGKIAR